MFLKRLSVIVATIAAGLMLSGYTGFPEIAGPRPAKPNAPVAGSTAKFQAIVRDNEAVFIFPVDPAKEYRWCLFDTTYLWNVDVKDNAFNVQYQSGYAPVRQGDPRCVTGKLREMLLQGGASVFKKSAAGFNSKMPRVLIEHELSADGTQLMLKLWDANVIKEMFASKPKQVVFQWQLLDQKSSKRVAVNYPSGANPATTRLTSQVIGTWSAVDKQATIEFRKDMTWSASTGSDGKRKSGKWRTLDNGRAVGMEENGEVSLVIKMAGSVLILNGTPLHKAGTGLSGSTDGSTIGSVGSPTQVAKDFVLAVTKGDATLVAKEVSKYFMEMVNQQGGLARWASEGSKDIEARGGYTIVNVESEVIAGDTAEVTFKSTRGKETDQRTNKFVLIRENGLWKIIGLSW